MLMNHDRSSLTCLCLLLANVHMDNLMSIACYYSSICRRQLYIHDRLWINRILVPYAFSCCLHISWRCILP
ncbi:hypothetical protein EDD18DRAFT_649130 [Armillaria luteobubalina]|uniref:Secreted protein n=1 Tax=Armillaria luteobubalina TaxID=153913 RepID=A0AA39PPA8_9AGAR|nr:hypothetical protein EDD18DRAFT_649130 [Armillaria luteobubalina]